MCSRFMKNVVSFEKFPLFDMEYWIILMFDMNVSIKYCAANTFFIIIVVKCTLFSLVLLNVNYTEKRKKTCLIFFLFAAVLFKHILQFNMLNYSIEFPVFFIPQSIRVKHVLYDVNAKVNFARCIYVCVCVLPEFLLNA